MNFEVVMQKLRKLIDAVTGLVKNNKYDLDNDGKVESLTEEIKGLFSQFGTMKDALENANKELRNVIEDENQKQEEERIRLEKLMEAHNRKMAESHATIEKAGLEIDKNERLKEKVEEFTV